MFIIQFLANILALVYAFLISQRPPQITYSAALFMLMVVLVTIYRLWRKYQRISTFTGGGGRSFGLTGQAFDHRVAAPLAEGAEMQTNSLSS